MIARQKRTVRFRRLAEARQRRRELPVCAVSRLSAVIDLAAEFDPTQPFVAVDVEGKGCPVADLGLV